MQWLPLKVLQFFKNSRNGVARLYEQKQHECELVTTSYWPKRRVHVIQLRLNLSPCMPQYRAILSALHVLWVKLLIKILIRLSQDVPGCPRMSQAHWQVCIVSIFGCSAWRVRPWHNLAPEPTCVRPDGVERCGKTLCIYWGLTTESVAVIWVAPS